MSGGPRAGAERRLGARARPRPRHEAQDRGLKTRACVRRAQTPKVVVDRSAMQKLGSTARFFAWGSLLSLTLSLGCQKSAPEPESKPEEPKAEPATPPPAATPPTETAATTASAAPAPAPAPGPKTTPVASVPVSPDDPLAGKFTLDDATKGLTGTGDLYAD